jgi:hypothetical protein
MFLKLENTVRFVDADSIDDLKLSKEVPIGVWKLSCAQFIGFFLEETEVKLSHGKIYGDAQSIADHIVEAFEKNDPNKNLGVLLSGDKGLGKTLTTRLVLEKFYGKKPIIIISDYINGMVDFISNFKGCVILMDEFEKFTGGNTDSEDKNSLTKQESLLSVFDGNTGCSGNLFLLTVNDTYRINENLKSRPGRIRYHYKFASENATVVRNYCNDNLNNKDLIEDVVSTLGGVGLVSMDILSSFVDELNKFPDKKPSDVLKYFNIENENTDENFKLIAKVLWGDIEVTYVDRAPLRYFKDSRWLSWKVSDDKVAEKLRKADIPDNISISIDEDADISSYFENVLSEDDYTINNETFEQTDSFDEEDLRVLKVVVKSTEMDRKVKRYNTAF